MALLKENVPTNDVYVADATESTGTQLTEVNKSTTALATMSMSDIDKALYDQGFEYLVDDFLSTSNIKLEHTEFQTTDGESLGSEFLCQFHSNKVQYLYRALQNGRVMDNKNDLLYTLDKESSTSGKDVAEWVKAQEAAGREIEIKEYMLVMAFVPKLNDIFILSVPPMSASTCTKFIRRIMLRGGKVSDHTVKVKVGPKNTKGQNPYYPWNFEFVD